MDIDNALTHKYLLGVVGVDDLFADAIAVDVPMQQWRLRQSSTSPHGDKN